MLAQATKTGPGVAAFCEMVMADRRQPEQGFRTCLGVLSFVKAYGPERVDAACQRGVTIRARTVTSIRSILKTGLDRAFLQDPEEAAPPPARQQSWRRQLPLRKDQDADPSHP